MAQTLAVIGGSGIYDIPGLTRLQEHVVETPFGAPSSAIREGWLGDTRLLFLARHGAQHQLPPHRINYRANICALKTLGASLVVSLSAVGSLQESIRPGDVVVVDQYIDLTRSRIGTFFDAGVVAHVGFADPTCPILGAALASAAEQAGGSVIRGGTYICMEGPQFSTRAESRLYRTWGAAVIGMTALPEAKLAREAELPYATLALCTDYDCWREETEAVSVETVLAVLKANATFAGRAVHALAAALPDCSQSPARQALRDALITPLAGVSSAERERLRWLVPAFTS